MRRGRRRFEARDQREPLHPSAYALEAAILSACKTAGEYAALPSEVMFHGQRFELVGGEYRPPAQPPTPQAPAPEATEAPR